jgi:serine/threonine-protein kinase
VREQTLPLEVARRLEPVCDRFEDDWLAGRRPRLEEFLEGAAEADRPALLRELLGLELDYRARRGERPEPEEYRRRLPGHAAVIDAVFAASPAPGLGAPPAPVVGAGEKGSALGGDRLPPPPLGAPALPFPSVPGFEVVAELGRGGMGVVYKARQLGFNRVVALKMVLPGTGAGPTLRDRFRAEAEAVARLHHPGVVQVHAFGEHEGQPYFAMEYLEGGSLARRLKRKPPPEREAAALVQRLAEAVHAAHRAQVLHRDLKPSNVLLDADGAPKVSDFGLAKLLDGDEGQTQTGAVLGTPSYMAPEQARGETRAVGAPADVYALGAILYECLTGKPPFKGATRQETLEQVRTCAPVPPTKVRPGASRDLEAVCLKCLEKEPRRRYPSADALAEDLGRWLRGEPTKARPAGRARRVWRGVRRRPAAAAGLLLALLAPFGVVAIRASRPPLPPDPDAPLLEIQRGLAAGNTVTLIGETGGPRWSRWQQGAKKAQVSAGSDEAFGVHAWGLTLLELVRDPPCERYQVRAQIRHHTSENEGEVGLYFSHRLFLGPGAPVHFFVHVGYNDVVPKLGPPLPLPRRQVGNRVRLIPRLYAEGGEGSVWDDRLGGPASELFRPGGFAGGPWRTLVLEVRPDRACASWQGLPVGELTAKRVADSVASALKMRAKRPDGASLPATVPALDARGGMGLFVFKSSVSFRQVAIEPLRDER